MSIFDVDFDPAKIFSSAMNYSPSLSEPGEFALVDVLVYSYLSGF